MEAEQEANQQTVEKRARLAEALLFVSGEPVSRVRLCELLDCDDSALTTSLSHLHDTLKESGLRILENAGFISLVTAPEASVYVEKFIKEEVLGELSKAAIETLTIVAYKHPVTRAEIDYIRGVNSGFTLRNLVMRGLVEREQDKRDARIYAYKPTLELMKYLGIHSFKELPHYAEFRQELENHTEEKNADSL